MKTPQVWPVIHVTTEANALEDIKMIMDAGCSGAFLISMTGQDDDIDPIVIKSKELYPKFPIGVNYLSMVASHALQRSLNLKCDATWSDNCGITSKGYDSVAFVLERMLLGYPNHLYFGSVAFKYQPHEDDPGFAARVAELAGMIPTTSGSSTGHPPSVEKLETMRGYVQSLAVASGISSENVSELGPYVTHILIASAISNQYDRIDKDKLTEFMDKVSQLNV